MRANDLSDLLKRKPFVPMRIYMSDGTTYEIRHPETYLFGQSYIAIALKQTPEGAMPGRVMFCSLGQIVRVEDIVVEAKQKA
ncbi:MAG: hypothetical protein ABSE73_00225 [Planctomycetota bacterium]